MRRLISSAALALVVAGLGSGSASAGTNRYDDGSQTFGYHSLAGERSDADLKAAAQVCDARVAAVPSGFTPSDDYRQCMREQGWKYGYTARDGRYPDPCHPGRMCHDFVILGVVGSSCSNY